MTAAFTIAMPSNILENQSCVGLLNGTHPNLVCATTGQKLMVHYPQATSAENQVQFLNINKSTKALAAHNFGGSRKFDVLLIGSENSLQSYGVEQNNKYFDVEISEGVNSLCVGALGSKDNAVVLVGGKCSIQGFGPDGEERFWTVTGDNVTSLALIPWSGQDVGSTLVVGSEDRMIRVYQGEEAVNSVQETGNVVALVPTLMHGRFVYVVNNGTVGVYTKTDRNWRFKTKHQCVSVATCDVDFDGIAEVCCGFSNGKFDIRSDAAPKPGDTVFKDTLKTSINGVISADYRQEGRMAPMVCSFDGEVRGYVAVASDVTEAVQQHEQETLELVMQEKKQLEFELTNLEKLVTKNSAEIKAFEAAQRNQAPNAPAPQMPQSLAEVKVTCKLKPNPEAKALDITFSVDSGATIHSAVISAEVVFGSNDHLNIVSDEPMEKLVATIMLEKDVPAELRVSVIVQVQGSDMLQVHDHTVRLPKFSMYIPVKELDRVPVGNLVVRIGELTNRLQLWAQSAFSACNSKADQTGAFVAFFNCLRDGHDVAIFAKPQDGGELRIHSDSMDIVGEMIQDIGAYLGIQELQSLAEFPIEFGQFEQVLMRVDDYNAARMKFSAEMADSTQLVKSLVIKAEDARILGDMKAMRRTYGSLYEINRELMGEFMKRSNNHNELMAALHEVNAMIQKAAKLRIGNAKATLVAECRSAIRANNIHTLFNIIRTGKTA